MVSDGGRQAPASGKHDRATWAGLLCAVVREARTGVLTVRFGKSWKRFEFALGVPVNYATDRQDDLISQALDRSEPDDRAEHLKEAIAASLEWATGEWAFDEGPELDPELIDPALLPDPVTLAGLWLGAKQHVAMDEAMPIVTGQERFARAPDFAEWFPLLEVEAPFDELPAALAGGCTSELLFRRLPDRTGNLVKLLWLLQRGAMFEGQLGLRVEMGSLLEGLHLDDSQADVEMFVEDDSIPRGAEQPGSTSTELHVGDETGFDIEVTDDEDDEEEESAAPAPATEGPSVAGPVPGTPAVAEPPQEEPPQEEPPPVPVSRPGRYVTTSVVPDEARPSEPSSQPAPQPSPPREPPSEAPAAGAASESKPKKPARDPVQVVRRDYKHRMGKDYYRFLNIEPDAPASVIERRSRQLAGRWQVAQRSRHIPQDVKDLARELANGVQLVYRTLADPERRAEYDRRRAQGQAPVLRPIKGATRFSTPSSPRPTRPEPAPLHAAGGAPTLNERISHFVEAGEWKLAAGLLQEARLVNPSDPDVLAQLGWVTWQLDKDRDSAEEFLKLAVAFDAEHAMATIYLGKLMLEVGDEEGCIKWLNRVMELDRSQRWARRALRKLAAEHPDAGKQPGLKFWKKGD